MIGRGALGSPWLFRQVDRYFDDAAFCPRAARGAHGVMLRHLRLICENKGGAPGDARGAQARRLVYEGDARRGRFRKRSGELCTYEDAVRLASDVLAANPDIREEMP